VQEETNKLKAKSEQINKDQQLYNKLEARLEELNNEVRQLEGQLADYNLALDKLRTNTRPEDVKNTYQHVKNNNEKLKLELDEIFLERKKIEEQTDSMQNELQNIHKQMELRLNELDPYQRTEYQKLIAENSELIN
jgi:intraflagellar transport protein 74